MSLAAGTVLSGRFRVLRRLGEGGMGNVYLVEDLARPGAVWALKELADDPAATAEDVAWARRRFDDEIALMRTLRHPRLPAFVEAVNGGGRRCFVMEYIPGETLQERLDAARGPLPEADVLAWAAAVCEALTYLHGLMPPVIVRDLKPSNVMVTPAGDVRLIDLGIARTYKVGKLSNTENLGTMTYASPEHLGHTQTDARSDIYSLGATMYHLLTGHEPAPMETPVPGSLRRFVPSLGEATEALVIRAMRLDPAQRFQSARELRDGIERCRALLGPAPAASRQQPPVSRAPVATRPIPAVSVPPTPTSRARTSTGGTNTPVAGVACPVCGYVNRASARFCAQDGVSLATGAAPAANATMATTPPAAPRVSGAMATTAAVSVERASEAFQAGRFAQTVRQCEAAIALGRATAEIYLLLGRAQRALGNHAESAEAFAHAGELRPSSQSLILEAEERAAAGTPELALVALTRARQLDPRNAEVSLRLGLISLELGRLSQAEGDLSDALAMRPDAPEMLVALARVRAARGDWAGAAEQCRKALAVAPADAAAHVELGRALVEQQRMQEARRVLERALRLSPTSADARRLLAQASAGAGARAGRKPSRRVPDDAGHADRHASAP